MRAGLLRHKITIQRVSESQDSYGEADQTWSTFRIVKAGKRNLSGQENQVNDVRNPVRMVEFKIHYISGVTNKMRIKHGDAIFNILFTDNLNDLNRDLVIVCREVV